MGSKVMPWAVLSRARQQISIHSWTMYAHMVTAEPGAIQYVSGAAIATGGNYAPITLTDIGSSSANRTISDGEGGAKYILNNAVWPAVWLGSATPIVGLIICDGTSSGSQVYSYVERLVGGVPTPWVPPTAAPGVAFSMDLFTNGFWRDENPAF